MKQKNIYRADDFLLKIAAITGVIGFLAAINIFMQLSSGISENSDPVELMVGLLLAIIIPASFFTAGWAIRNVEKKYITIWNMLERSVEVTISELQSSTGYPREAIINGIRDINRRAHTSYLIDEKKDLVYDGRLSGQVRAAATCPSCGGEFTSTMKLSLTQDSTCPYCGSTVNLSSLYTYKDEKLEQIRNEHSSVLPQDHAMAPKKEFNMVLFTFLIIFFWPAAIIYVIRRYPLRK